MKTRKAYKLFRLRRDGTIGSLFINRRRVIPEGEWLPAEDFPTKGYKRRPGWHVLPAPHAPHLSTTGRVWRQVEIKDFAEFTRPESQGGVWLLANWMRVVPEKPESFMTTPKRYRLTRWTQDFVWLRWEGYGSQRKGLSRRMTVEKFERLLGCHPSQFMEFYPEGTVSL